MKSVFDKATRKWFSEHIRAETTVMQCKKCGLWYKPSLEHKCEFPKKCGVNNNQLTEREKNTCELCADYNMGNCEKCELKGRVAYSEERHNKRLRNRSIQNIFTAGEADN